MLTKLKEFVKTNFNAILLALLIFLVSLFSFAVGFLAARYQEKEPIRIEPAESLSQ